MKISTIQVYYIPPKRTYEIIENTPIKKKIDYSKVMKTATAIIAIGMFNIKQLLAQSATESKIDTAGLKIWGIGKRVARWVALVMLAWEIIKALKDQDANKIWGIIAKYAIAYGSMYGVPWLFDLIEDTFS